MRRALLLPLAVMCLSYAALAQDGGADWAGASVGGPKAPDGTPIQVLLPPALHMKNTGGMGLRGPGTGSGLCVFTSIEMNARVQNVAALDGLQKYMTTREGGGWPAKVDAVLKAFCASKGVPVPPYLNVEGKDLDLLRLALRTGRPVGVTTAYLPGYPGRISHMTCLMHAKGDWWGILDNNYPGRWAWLSTSEFTRSYTAFGNGWCVILLAPAPPPAPKE